MVDVVFVDVAQGSVNLMYGMNIIVLGFLVLVNSITIYIYIF